MTLKEYEQKLNEVKQAWDKMPNWVKVWTRLRLIQMQKEIK